MTDLLIAWTNMDLVRVRVDWHEVSVCFRGFWSVFWWDWCSWIYSCGYSRFYPWLYWL